MNEDKSPESIKAAMLTAAADSGVELETVEGGFLDHLFGPIALELWKRYDRDGELLAAAFPDEGSGAYIDKACARYGITRKAGTFAQATVTLTGTAGTTVPAGTGFLTAGGLEFDLISGVTLTGGADTGTVRAAEAGAAYNTQAGALVRMVRTVVGLSSFSSGAAAGGADTESDEALFARLDARQKAAPTSGNAYQYQVWALETPGVGAAKVLPLWSGAGTVKVLLADAARHPVASSVVSAAAGYIETQRPIGAAVTVESAEGVSIAVSAAVSVDASTTKEAAETEFAGKLETYLQGLAFVSYTVLYNRIAYLLLDTTGVINYTTLTVNGGTGNVTLSAAQIPTKGEVTLT